MSHDIKRYPVHIAVLLLFALTGTLVLIFTRAATPQYTIEPETGQLSGTAVAGTDQAASGGGYVNFTASSGGGTPAYCTTGGAQLWANLEACGWPGPSNTGASSATMTNYPNGLTISAPGVYENLAIKGFLNINAPNVTMRNFTLTNVTTGSGGYTAVRIDQSATNVLLEDCEIYPNFVTQFSIWGFDGITVRRCEIHHAGEGIQARQNLVFENNYCHDIDDIANDGDDWHTNCVIAVNDARGVSGWKIIHNTLRLGTPNGLKYYSAPINTLLADNNTIDNNLIANGSYAVYLFDSRAAPVAPTRTVITNNKFSTIDSSKVGLYGIWYNGQGWAEYSPLVTFSGNKVIETGANANGVNP